MLKPFFSSFVENRKSPSVAFDYSIYNYRKPIYLNLINDSQQVRHLGNNAAGRCRIGAFDRLIELCYPKALYDLLLLFGVADHTPIILDFDLSAFGGFCFLCHNSNFQSMPRPRPT